MDERLYLFRYVTKLKRKINSLGELHALETFQTEKENIKTLVFKAPNQCFVQIPLQILNMLAPIRRVRVTSVLGVGTRMSTTPLQP